jgi:serine/threonine protein kinase
VGEGSFGIVRQCKSLLDGAIYAIKSIPLNRNNVNIQDGDSTKQMQEVEIMRGLNHPNIIEYRGYFTDVDFGSTKEK